MSNSVQVTPEIERAKKFNINYFEEKNRYNKLNTVVYYGSAKEFFKLIKKKAFVQITKPDGFNENSKSRINIEVFVGENGKGVMITFKVNHVV